MFSNFLYFLVALIIYSTAEFFQTEQGIKAVSLFYAAVLYLLFYFLCQVLFKRLESRATAHNMKNVDYLVNGYISKLSILGLVIFSVVVYFLKLPLLFSGIVFLEILPTAKALIFLGIFLFSLVMVWDAAFRVQRRFFAGGIGKKSFLVSNLSFSLPALLPWFAISMVADLLTFVPFKPLKELLDTPAGEIGYVGVFLVAITVFGPVFIKKLWLCRPLEAGSARSRIEQVCKRAGLKYADILRWDLFGGNMITAGVMGILGRFRYILVTPALLRSLNNAELDAVMLHEIGHVQRLHMLFYLIFFAGFIACNFVLFEPMIQLLYIAQPLYSLMAFAGAGHSNIHSVMVIVFMIGGFLMYFRFVFGLFMRNFERQADLHIYRYIPDARPLITTFYKIAGFSGQDIDKPNWHHFGIGERIRFLEKCQENPRLIQVHHARVRKMVAVYMVIILAVFSLGYSVSYGHLKPGFETFIAEKILIQQMKIEPDNSDLYVLVGDYYYNKKEYQKAIDSYENVLRVDPDNVHALNNLSWLFATCPDKGFRDRHKALENARKALEQKREAFILDTYAEALFANDDVENAVKIAREALRVTKTKQAYYQGQLLRFEKKMAEVLELNVEKT